MDGSCHGIPLDPSSRTNWIATKVDAEFVEDKAGTSVVIAYW
jgi:hypothetical protein